MKPSISAASAPRDGFTMQAKSENSCNYTKIWAEERYPPSPTHTPQQIEQIMLGRVDLKV